MPAGRQVQQGSSRDMMEQQGALHQLHARSSSQHSHRPVACTRLVGVDQLDALDGREGEGGGEAAGGAAAAVVLQRVLQEGWQEWERNGAGL